MNQKPRIRIADLVAAFAIIFSMLIFLIMLFLFSVNSSGATYEILNTLFTIFLRIFEGTLLFGGVGLIIQLLRIMAWYIITPKWLQERYKGGRNG